MRLKIVSILVTNYQLRLDIPAPPRFPDEWEALWEVFVNDVAVTNQ